MSRPNTSLRMASTEFSDLQPKVGPAAHNERRDGWCGGVHFLLQPNHLNLNYPGASNKRLSLKLLVLQTQIPVACVGVLTISGHAHKFSAHALTRSRGWDAWLPLAGTPLCQFSGYSTPGHHTASEPTSSLNTGSALSGDFPSMPTWRVGSPGPFLRVTRAQYTTPVAYGAPGPASAGHPCPLRYPGPPWAPGLPRPTSPVPGVPTQRYSPFVATLPTRQQGSCTPSNRFRAYTPTNSKTTSILSI